MDVQEISPVGERVIMTAGPIIVGASIGNSYFNEENIRKILKWLAIPRPVYFMIPDEPAVYTLRACGKNPQEAARIARLRSNNLEHKCRRIIEECRAGLPTEIIRWNMLSGNETYQSSLKAITDLYEKNTEFRKNVRLATEMVIRSNGIAPSDDSIDIGVNFLLQELAFISRADWILEVRQVAYLYHKTMDILRDLLEKKKYPFAPSFVGFITLA